MELTDSLKGLLQDAAEQLKGSARRVFMARTVKQLGPGGQRRAERALGWNRVTIRKGTRELASGFAIVDAFALRGRKRAEEHLPNLLADLTAIVDGQSQADPQFRTNRLYTRLTAAEVRRQLIAQQGYTDAELPTRAVSKSSRKVSGVGRCRRKARLALAVVALARMIRRLIALRQQPPTTLTPPYGRWPWGCQASVQDG